MSDYMKELYALPNQFIDAWKAQGKKVVGTVCCHIPEELIYAADVLPIRIRATGCTDDTEAALWMSSFSCSFARGCLEQMSNGALDFMDGVIFSDGCDMIHRIYDNWDYNDKSQKFRHQFYAPRIVHENAPQYFKEDVELLKDALEKWTGNKITEEKLANAIRIYNESRTLMNRLYELRKQPNPPVSGEDCLQWTLASMSMPKDIFNKLLGGFLARIGQVPPVTGKRARLVWCGGPVDEPSYLKIFEDAGALIVNDFQCYGRARNIDLIPAPKAGETWLDTMTETYLNRPVCPRMCTQHKEIQDIIIDMVKEYNADGVIYAWIKNCEVWGAELPRMKTRFEEEGIPMLGIEREQFQSNAGQVGIRIEAFLEMLEGRK